MFLDDPLIFKKSPTATGGQQNLSAGQKSDLLRSLCNLVRPPFLFAKLLSADSAESRDEQAIAAPQARTKFKIRPRRQLNN
jgi:hypothetical protein